MTKYIVNHNNDLNSENSQFMLQGISGSASPSSTSNVDWQFPQERWVTGGMLFVKNGHWGDTVTVSVVSKDGQGNATTIKTFVDSFKVREDSQHQLSIEAGYPVLVSGQLYLRIRYVNTSLLETSHVAVNLYSHIPADVP